jgi:PAS domain S-box-containing protein
VGNIQQGLTEVAEGRFDAMLATMALASYHMAEMGLHNIKVVGKTTVVMDLTLFVDKGQPLLHSIIEKSLHGISRQESQGIMQRWIKREYVERPDYRLVLEVSLFLLLVLVGAVGWNLFLRREIQLRRKAEDKLRGVVSRYQLIMDGAGAGVRVWDVANKRVEFSPKWKAMRGYADDEVSDNENEWAEGIHPDDRERVMAAVQEHFAGNTVEFEEEYRVSCKDGSWIWVHDQGKAFRDAEANAYLMAGTEIDITERKQMSDALERRIVALTRPLDDPAFAGQVLCSNRRGIHHHKNGRHAHHQAEQLLSPVQRYHSQD